MTNLPSQEYWKKRSLRTLLENEKTAEEYNQELLQAYNSVADNISKELEAFYGKYAEDNKISLAQTRRRLSSRELGDYNRRVKKYLSEVKKLGDNVMSAEYKKNLEAMSGRAYVSRMEELMTNIRHEIEMVSAKNNIDLGTTLESAYEDGFYRTVFDIQKRSGMGVSFTTPGKVQLQRAVRTRWNGRNYSDSIWQNKNKLIAELETIIPQEFVRGRGLSEVSRELAGRVGVSYRNARRLVRTEMNYVSNKGTLDAYKETGVVDEYIFLATLDSRTSVICATMDGKKVELKEGVQGVTIPPLHPNCRSTTIPYFKDDEFNDRVARNAEGKSVKLGENMTFYEWAEKFGSSEFKEKVKRQRNKYLGIDTTQKVDMAEPFNKSMYSEFTKDETTLSVKTTTNWLEGEGKDLMDYVVKYTGSGYLWANRWYRENKNRELDDYEQEFIDRLNEVLDKAPSALNKDAILYRATGYSSMKEILSEDEMNYIYSLVNDNLTNDRVKKLEGKLKQKLLGVELKEKAFMSTATKKGAFGKSKPIQFTIYASEGSASAVHISGVSLFKNEAEVLFPPGTKAKIRGLHRDSMGASYGNCLRLEVEVLE